VEKGDTRKEIRGSLTVLGPTLLSGRTGGSGFERRMRDGGIHTSDYTHETLSLGPWDGSPLAKKEIKGKDRWGCGICHSGGGTSLPGLLAEKIAGGGRRGTAKEGQEKELQEGEKSGNWPKKIFRSGKAREVTFLGLRDDFMTEEKGLPPSESIQIRKRKRKLQSRNPR